MHVNFKKMAWISPSPGVRFKSFIRNGRQLRFVEFNEQFREPDWCEKGHIGYILEGILEIDFNGKKQAYEPGDGLFILKGDAEKHKARAIGGPVRLILVEEIDD